MKNNFSNMMSLDIFISSISDSECENIMSEITPLKESIMPLASWDIFSQDYNLTLENLKIESDIDFIKLFAQKAHWKNEIDGIFKDQDFEALIITDINQKILWVNNGFTEMTGYTKKYALNKTPNFLQGQNTLPETKKRIRGKLDELKPFAEIITNYKKDKTPYKCEVKIIPLYTDKVTHFLAIERKVV
jgi:PAS domain S-box-containing protein|tara:strand:- start:1273 stop:1839 length:567 start_codon:yes stop_codon:yes gene_type:complete